jgi:hypothetical protein
MAVTGVTRLTTDAGFGARRRACSAAVAVLLASALAACHAHGASGVDHGVTVAFTRSPANLSSVQLSFQNASSEPVCLDPPPFQSAAFDAKTDHGVEKSITPALPSSGGCVTLAPGGRLSQTVDAGAGHSRWAEQTGAFCYNYAFHGTAAAAWQAAGQVCE